MLDVKQKMKFVSQYKKYKLWIEPAYHTTDNLGRRSYHAGICAKFENGVYETSDPKIIEALLKDPVCGSDYAPVKISEDTVPAPELASSQDNYAWTKEEKPVKKAVYATCEKCGKECYGKLGYNSHMRSHK